jgi:hypothetical protein
VSKRLRHVLLLTRDRGPGRERAASNRCRQPHIDTTHDMPSGLWMKAWELAVLADRVAFAFLIAHDCKNQRYHNALSHNVTSNEH